MRHPAPKAIKVADTVCDFGTSPVPPTSKNKSGLVKVPEHFNVY